MNKGRAGWIAGWAIWLFMVVSTEAKLEWQARLVWEAIATGEPPVVVASARNVGPHEVRVAFGADGHGEIQFWLKSPEGEQVCSALVRGGASPYVWKTLGPGGHYETRFILNDYGIENLEAGEYEIRVGMNLEREEAGHENALECSISPYASFRVLADSDDSFELIRSHIEMGEELLGQKLFRHWVSYATHGAFLELQQKWLEALPAIYYPDDIRLLDAVVAGRNVEAIRKVVVQAEKMETTGGVSAAPVWHALQKADWLWQSEETLPWLDRNREKIRKAGLIGITD